MGKKSTQPDGENRLHGWGLVAIQQTQIGECNFSCSRELKCEKLSLLSQQFLPSYAQTQTRMSQLFHLSDYKAMHVRPRHFIKKEKKYRIDEYY